MSYFFSGRVKVRELYKGSLFAFAEAFASVSFKHLVHVAVQQTLKKIQNK
jgi:hypothetical protein